MQQPRQTLVRPVADRQVGGVAAGLANLTNVPVQVVRAAFVLTTIFASGLGVLVYVLIWALTPQEGSSVDAARRAEPPARRLRQPESVPATRHRLEDNHRRELIQLFLLGSAAVLGGLALLANQHGYSLDIRSWLPFLVLGAGAVVGLAQLDRTERARWMGNLGLGRWTGLLRLLAGVCLAVLGVILAVQPRLNAAQLTTTLIAAAAVLAGVALVLAPWGLRMLRDLEAERTLRAREAERAEITAHLHDSVLQTLALIQRRPGDAAEVTRLARAQERELRAWLYGGTDNTQEQPGSLKEAVRRVCAEREDTEGIAIDLIVVGDAPLNEHTNTLVQALREAVSNAARHGKIGVSVYVECDPDALEAFVRDRGQGFDPATIPMDRFGVRGSIVDRMERHGGTAQLRTAPGEGTEVILRLPTQVEEGSRVAEGSSHE